MLWRNSKPVSRKRQPQGFIVPSQPTLADRAPSGPKWIHEIKHDGYRLIAVRRDGVVRLWSRHCTDFTGTFIQIGEAVAALPGGDLMIDGEAVVLRPDGHSDFNALRSRSGAASATMVAFDLLHHDGQDVRKAALEERRQRLATIVQRSDGLYFSEALDGDGVTIFQHAAAMGLEGIVSKRLGTPYRSGRCANWLKTKSSTFVRR
jgi:bifunctional non-homologous end joining protein LigD